MGNDSDEFTIDLTDVTFCGARQAHGIRENRVEHRLKLSGRARNHSENLAGRGLLLQRLGQLTVPVLQFPKQPDVFDSNCGLISKGSEERDLLVREGMDFHTADCDSPNRYSFSQQRRREHSPLTEALLENLPNRKLCVWLCCEVMHVDRFSVDDGSACYRTAIAGHTLIHPREWSVMRGQPQDISIDATDEGVAGTAHARGILCYSI
jgi:hypothetical protein